MDPRFSAPELSQQQIEKTRRNGGWPRNRDINWNVEASADEAKTK